MSGLLMKQGTAWLVGLWVPLVLCVPAWSAEPPPGASSVSSSEQPAEQHAVPPLSLTEAIRIGIERHPDLARLGFERFARIAAVDKAKGARLPWIEGSVVGAAGSLRIVSTDGKVIHDQGGHGFDPGGALPKHNQNMLTLGGLVNQLITDFGQTASRILADEAREAASQQAISTGRALVILGVKQAYLETLLQQSQIEVAERTLKARQAIRDQIAAFHRRQLKSKVDLDLVEVEVANAELALIRARNDLGQRFAALNNAMGLQETTPYRLEPASLGTLEPGEVERLVEEALEHRPELLGLQDRIRAAVEDLRAAKALHYGSITAVGVLGTTFYGQFRDSGIGRGGPRPRSFYGVGETLALPIFTGFEIQSRIGAAQHRKGATDQELRNLINDIVLQVERAYLTQTSNLEQVKLERERVGFAKEALSLAQPRYRLGLSSIVELVQATTNLFEAESRLLEAQYLSKIAEATVAYATGRDYRLFEPLHRP